MKDKNKVINILSIVILIVVCFIYLYSKGTYTIYESKIGGYIYPDIAKWSIKVNDVVVTTKDVATVDISDIEWSLNHVAVNKAAPGSKGILNINIDPMSTEVAIRYDIEIIDKTVDPLKILTVSSVTDSSNELVRTGQSTYTGVITLDDINKNNIKNVEINLDWLDDNTEIEFDEQEISSDDYLTINFKAVQYNGEIIIPFTGD